MVQQLHLAFESASVAQSETSDSLLEQTRELFQHDGSNAELMTQIMSAIRVLHDLCDQSDAAQLKL